MVRRGTFRGTRRVPGCAQRPSCFWSGTWRPRQPTLTRWRAAIPPRLVVRMCCRSPQYQGQADCNRRNLFCPGSSAPAWTTVAVSSSASLGPEPMSYTIDAVCNKCRSRLQTRTSWSTRCSALAEYSSPSPPDRWLTWGKRSLSPSTARWSSWPLAGLRPRGRPCRRRRSDATDRIEDVRSAGEEGFGDATAPIDATGARCALPCRLRAAFSSTP